MNASRTDEPMVWRGAILGAALFVGFSLLPYYLLENPPALFWLASVFAVAGGLIGHLGFQKTSGLVGPACGMALGLFTGAIVGDQIGGYLPVEAPVVDVTGEGPANNQFGQKLAISGPTVDGKTFDLTEWRGKVVLVDFWATWCGPCVAELPNVKKAYARYHKDGFEVVGVSLDKERARLVDFLKTHDVPWPQIFNDDPGQSEWNNPLVQKYRVRGIPTAFLLDREGVVAPIDPIGEKLMPAIDRLLAGNDSLSDLGSSKLQVGLFRMGLFIGACLGGYLGLQFGDFAERWLRRRRILPAAPS